jgi:hypothetical protein
VNAVERLEALANAATTRPWRHGVQGWIYHGSATPICSTFDDVGEDVRDDNAELIVAAVNVLPELLKIAHGVERLRAGIKSDIEQLGDFVTPPGLTAGLRDLFEAAEPLFSDPAAAGTETSERGGAGPGGRE